MNPFAFRREIFLRHRIFIWLATALLAAAVIAVPYFPMLPILVMATWMFPMGLQEFFSTPATSASEDTWLIAGWLAYHTLTFCGLLQRRALLYWIFYTAFCALLILNVIGCHKMIANYHD